MSIWPNAVLRGDANRIEIGTNSNVQDNAVIHCSENYPTIIGKGCTIGHCAVINGATVGDLCIIGMNCTILDGAVIGEDSVVGAGALVTEGTIVPAKSLILGSPAKVKRPVTEKELVWIKESSENYVKYASQYIGDTSKAKTGFQM